MKPSTVEKLKRFISILLIVFLISSFVMLAGCKSGAFNPDPDDVIEEPEEEEEEEEEILEVIRNGNFSQYTDTSATAFPVTPKNWSPYDGNSYGGQKAPSTSGTDIRYGTISVKDEYYNADPEKFKTDKMKKGANEPLDNPGYPEIPGKEEDDNDKILMLENIKPTAAKSRTSSSVSVPINSYAIISVWVNTTLIGEDGNPLSALKAGQGATISITGDVDKPVILYGINTGGFWKEYQFIIEGSSVANKNITLELGLGTGHPLNSQGYTEGFAFFANVEMTYITQKAFDEYKNEPDINRISFKFEETNYGTHQEVDFNNPDKITRVSYSFKNGGTIQDLTDFIGSDSPMVIGGTNGTDFTIINTSISNLSDNLKGDLTKFPFTNDEVILIEKTSTKNASAGIIKEDFLPTVQEGGYYRISFWAKTSDLYRSGLNVYLVSTSYSGGGDLPQDHYKNFSNINTTAYKLNLEEKDKVTNANKWDDWRQYSFYVDSGMFERSGTTTKNLSLEIWFGSVTINYEVEADGKTFDAKRSIPSGSKEADFPEINSYALITNIEVEELFRSVYSSASSSDNSITGFSLSDRYGSNSFTNSSFNNVKAADTLVTDKLMQPANFTGSYRPGAAQSNPYGGIVNTNLIAKYPISAPWYNSFLNAVDILKAFQGGDWNSLLMIYNEYATAYGYVSDNTISLSANSYKAISVSVKTMGSATANIYLVDSDGKVLGDFILDKYGNKVSGPELRNEEKGLVYNPFYEEKYDTESDKYKKDPEYENSDENKLLRKGTKDVVASTIPVENPFYVKDYDRTKDTTKDADWKKDLKPIKYFVYENEDYYTKLKITETNLFKRIDINNYNNTAEVLDITTVTSDPNDTEGFKTYTFLIKTGNSSKNVKLELWNGQKYPNKNDFLEGKANSEGAVFFDEIMESTLTKEAFYEYVFNEKKISGEELENAMFFDMSGYDNISDPKASSADSDHDHDHDDDTTPFNWVNLVYIIPTSIMVIALAFVVIKKFMKKKKKVEQTVTEKPTYAREKTSKKSADKDEKN